MGNSELNKHYLIENITHISTTCQCTKHQTIHKQVKGKCLYTRHPNHVHCAILKLLFSVTFFDKKNILTVVNRIALHNNMIKEQRVYTISDDMISIIHTFTNEL